VETNNRQARSRGSNPAGQNLCGLSNVKFFVFLLFSLMVTGCNELLGPKTFLPCCDTYASVRRHGPETLF